MRTWILIADGSGARILEALGEGSGFHPVSGNGTLRDDAPRSLDGRGDADGGSQRGNVMGSRPNVAGALEVLFASQLAAMLAGYVRTNAFDRLIIVAPSAMLGGKRSLPKSRRI